MQVYRYMDIGSAKILKEEMQGIPHYLVDVLMPEEEFNVCRFKEMAQEALSVIYERGHIPIIVGEPVFIFRPFYMTLTFQRKGIIRLCVQGLKEKLRKMGWKISTHNFVRLILCQPGKSIKITPNALSGHWSFMN